MIRTVSPVFAEFSSSCAFTRLVRVTIFPYTGCGTRRSIATTTVFCILSLTTIPVRVFRAFRSVACSLVISAMCHVPPRSARALELALAQDGLEACDILADPAQPKRIFEWFGRTAEVQTEALLLELGDLRRDVRHRHLADVAGAQNVLSWHPYAPPHAP